MKNILKGTIIALAVGALIGFVGYLLTSKDNEDENDIENDYNYYKDIFE